MNKILETTKFVVENSENVSINHNAANEFAKNFQHGNIFHWLSAAPFDFDKLNNEDKLNFLLVFNTISFSYWGEPKWTVKYSGQNYDGSWGMVVCIKRVMDEGRQILDVKYRAGLSEKDFGEILRGNVEIPLLKERLNFTKEVAGVLLEKYSGNFAELVKKAKGDAVELLEMIISDFSSFHDSAVYKDKEIFFYKRAQLLVSDVCQLFGGEGYGNLANIDQLTACADYKLPQVLRNFGILVYMPDLANKIDGGAEIQMGSKEEIEIRANTIWAVEFIKQELQKEGKQTQAIGINDHLWLMSQEKGFLSKPYHLTRTTAY